MSNKYLLAIDPANVQSAYVLCELDTLKPILKDKIPNEELFELIDTGLFEDYDIQHVAIEFIQSFGMPVGQTVFETCFTVGRLYERISNKKSVEQIKLIYRKEEKMCICGNTKAKDANIRRALIDIFAQHDFKNGRGVKKNPDWFYGFKADIWQAYAVAYTYKEKYIKKIK